MTKGVCGVFEVMKFDDKGGAKPSFLMTYNVNSPSGPGGLQIIQTFKMFRLKDWSGAGVSSTRSYLFHA